MPAETSVPTSGIVQTSAVQAVKLAIVCLLWRRGVLTDGKNTGARTTHSFTDGRNSSKD
jgi:hypothetical protein